MKYEEIEEIHLSLINGQKRQMTNQINDYNRLGAGIFFEDYKEYLEQSYQFKDCYNYFVDCTISYHRINLYNKGDK